MFFDPTTYIILGLMLIGVVVLLLQRRYITLVFGLAALFALVHYQVEAAMYQAIANGDGLRLPSTLPGYQPGDQLDWGWVNSAPGWVFDLPLTIAAWLAIVGAVLVVANMILNVVVKKGRASRPRWLTPVGIVGPRANV